VALGLPAARAAASDESGAFCTGTASLVLAACRAETVDDARIAQANCVNVSDPEARAECGADARAALAEARTECAAQYQARREVCGLLGEARYDPDFTPANFVSPDDIGAGVAPNPYFPLIAGTQWIYQGGDETITVKVTDKTKLIEGVTCRVVNDVVKKNGVVIEDTDDWYAQDVTGAVWYCGEIARDFELFAGDVPADPELVDIGGSWKTGREGAKPGFIMLAQPTVGMAYRQEMLLGDAEDVAEVVDISASENVPAAACNGNCLVTRDFSALEPDAKEHKFYAPGVGLILEVDDEGNRTELIGFTTP
jgi:hypothetical protein